MSATIEAPAAADFYVEPFPGRKGSDRIVETCGKCSGQGVINWGRVTVQRGNDIDRFCFQCGGSGEYSFLVSSRRATARREAKRRAELEASRLEADAAREAFREEHSATIAVLKAYAPKDAFLAELLDRIENGVGFLTEGQLAAVVPAIERLEAREAAKRPVQEGRYEIQGSIVSTKWQESPFGYGNSTLKMLVEVDGFKVWGSVPRGFDGPLERGDRVAFTATVEKSQDDESFGFFKRPTKARRLES